MLHLLDYTPEEFRLCCEEHGRPGFLADQVFKWIYGRQVTDFESMTNISKQNRAWLRDQTVIFRSRLDQVQYASDGTLKVLMGWDPPRTDPADLPVVGQSRSELKQTETVMIPASRRRTACVSSQVGCPV